MFFVLALAAVVVPTPPTPVQAQDIRCVALLALVANEQKRGSGWTDYPDLADDGADFAWIVGEDVMKATGRTREQVRDLLIAAVAAIQKTKALPHADVDRCAVRMHALVPPPVPPSYPRCAAIMVLAYDAVRARDGMTKDAKDLATLASVLSYRAKDLLIGEGKSGAEADAMIGAERVKAAKTGGAPEAELRRCADLAAPVGAP